MSKQITVAAVDLGAESGRVTLGHFDGTRVILEVVHRFENRSTRLNGTLHWNTVGLYIDILDGLRKAREVAGDTIASVGVDTWGVDFGILDGSGSLLGLPVHYRDSRTEGMIEEITAKIPREEIYAQSGIGFWPFNTLNQLYALAKADSPLLREGRALLFTPDLLHYWLSGVKASERSIASTSQCLAVGEDRWLDGLLGRLGIPAHLLQPVVPSGTTLGPVTGDVAAATGLAGMKVIVPACHDTASAVAATPLSSPDAAYLSCGTWSLLGIETATPMATPAALAADFTNEKGLGKTYRFLRNIMGLWLAQQARAAWKRAGQTFEYTELAAQAQQATPFTAWINPNDMRFYAPDNMVAAIQGACADTGQSVPESVGAVMRVIYESLAFTYRASVDELEALRGIAIPALHVIGGGSQNPVFMQCTANALGRPVIAGPVEGTALGNVLVQLMGLGHLADQAQMRDVVRQSVDVVTYEPQNTCLWQEAYGRFMLATALRG